MFDKCTTILTVGRGVGLPVGGVVVGDVEGTSVGENVGNLSGDTGRVTLKILTTPVVVVGKLV